MDIKITTLSENTTAAFGLLAEWGLSILVEAYGKKVLLDTGYSTSVVHNAKELGIDLGDIDTIVLSHGHSDHTGGLRDVLMRMQEQRKSRGRQTDTEIIAHPDVFAPKYACREGNERFVGMPCSREELEGLGARFYITV
jgi:7,8-dihydropterin-6-yl-methyl-4-(beta-D-ribofuranosyl)aminobenzene 5'-phosphate synthase